jgi:negative regulator of sigma E activity
MCQPMKKLQAQITKRSVAAMLVAAAVVGVSALSMHAPPTHNPNALARPLKSIQTDKAIQFHGSIELSRTSCVERVPAMTGESRALTENLKLVAAAF